MAKTTKASRGSSRAKSTKGTKKQGRTGRSATERRGEKREATDRVGVGLEAKGAWRKKTRAGGTAGEPPHTGKQDRATLSRAGMSPRRSGGPSTWRQPTGLRKDRGRSSGGLSH